uniref:POM121 transmembrane nucleoporin C n=1 Tax=Otolemur garnettii TaxID=30611 RepID=H0WY17_OTOGA
PPAKSVVKANLLESQTLLEGPDSAELLMGSYLDKLGLQQPTPALEGRDAPERTDRRPPVQTPPPALRPHPVRHVYPLLPTLLLQASPRPCHRDCGTSSSRFVMTPRRWHPLRQAGYSLPGVLPTVCRDGCPSKNIPLSSRHFKRVGGPVPVRIPALDRKRTRSAGAEQVISSALSSPPPDAPNSSAKDTVQSALQDRTKRTVGGEDQIFADGQESPRRCHDSGGTAHSALEPLVAKGVPASSVPEPEPLKRGSDSKSSENPLNKRSCSSCASSLASTYTCGIPIHSRNAITSSYSSTRGFSQLQKRRGPSSSHSSSRSQTQQRPAKKIRREEPGHHSRASTPPITDKESRGEKAADTTTWKEQNSWSSPSTPAALGRKRKFQLLPSRRGERLTLPPPPQLGYSVTAKDLDLEKKATFDWFNKLWGYTTDAASNYSSETPATMQPSFTFTPSPAETASSMTSLPDASSNPLLQSWNQMQNPPSLPSSPESARLAATQNHPSPMTHSLLAGMGFSQSGPFPDTTTDPTSTVVPMELDLASSAIPVTDTRSPVSLPPETLTKSQALSAPSSIPKQRFQFGMLSTPPSNPPSSSTLPKTTRPWVLTFQPIYSNRDLPPSVPYSAPFMYTTTRASAAITTPPLFIVPATAPSAVASISTAATSADPVFKPSFGHGLSSVRSRVSSTRSRPLTLHGPFCFGAHPASGDSFIPAKGSTFQVGKCTSKHASSTVTTSGFSSPLPVLFRWPSTQPAIATTMAVFSTPGSGVTSQSSSRGPISSLSGPLPLGTSAAPPASEDVEIDSLAAPTIPAFAATTENTRGGCRRAVFGPFLSGTLVVPPASEDVEMSEETPDHIATTSGFRATTQATSSGTSGSVFGPYTLAASAVPVGSRALGVSVSTPGSRSTSGDIGFGARQNRTMSTTTRSRGNLHHNFPGTPSRTSQVFSVASTPDNKPGFGATSSATFCQNTTTTAVGTSGSSLSYGASSTPNQGFVGGGLVVSLVPSL